MHDIAIGSQVLDELRDRVTVECDSSGSTLNICDAQFSDAGTYECVVDVYGEQHSLLHEVIIRGKRSFHYKTTSLLKC